MASNADNAGAASVSMCYGTSGDNLPPRSTVVDLLHENGVTVVRLYWPDPAALAGTGIRVVMGAPAPRSYRSRSTGEIMSGATCSIQSHQRY
jgi:hypothetical protein